jgi:Glycosyltransferase family 9 (heptosyltransferase)
MQHGANQVIIEAQPPLHSLLRNVRGVSEVISRKDALPQGLDFHAPFMRLPGLLKTTLETIPNQVPYIHADPELIERWKTTIEPHSGFRIGIAWQGRTAHRLDRQRSIILEKFLPLSRISGVRLFSLQFEEGSEQSKSPIAEQMQLIDLTDQVKDFSDTAALIQNLDLVIAIDTAVVHLAGALAKPVWTLLSFAPDFRWMLKREDSPWYPTMRLFRQAVLGDWEAVFDRAAEELKKQMTVGPL